MLPLGITSAAGVIALGAAMEGYLRTATTWHERVPLVAAAIVLIVPGLSPTSSARRSLCS
jgi:TRAP-type uncharacterized transport system fused permease subunit